ncbi:MAG: thiamine pyrophosphate-binding protein [Rhodospirillaceae bacterium]|jgi:acetolactate synthase I/II/III large subunit|nr:thiamine pyrophosphate-binding protein [Rhodospirillaceae bacterium]MBT5940690.1 thiamine pyrophosphate-binding protein [Rhodospirillaceae bacterium]MBT7266422.1 thiamine pyrophosphate-binding protein [Rhodospirillaceae bacterium]
MKKLTTGAGAIAKSIKNHGVDTVFALPGAQLDPLFDAFHAERETLRVIHTRHEQGAAYMALGYAQSTGREAVCAVVPGPGVLNAGAGLLTAYGNGAKVLCIGGQIPSKAIDKGVGLLHEMYDQKGTMAATTKWQTRIDTAEDAPAAIGEAFRQMNTGRQRPVFVEMAPDIMAAKTELDIPATNQDYEMLQPDPDLVEQAAALLGNAENPAIFVGGGIFGAEQELLDLAETLQAPVFMTSAGRGAVDDRHYLAQNMIGAARQWPKIDAALVVGTKFLLPINSWGWDDDVKLVRVDPDPDQSVGKWQPDVHLVAHGKPSLAAIADRVSRHNRSRESRKTEWSDLQQIADKDLAETLPGLYAYGDALRNELPEDGIVCFGVTQMGFYSWFGFPTYHPRTNLQAGVQGTLGFSFPTALGAQVAHPDKKVVCVTGDGGFMFASNELSTAIRHGINLVTIVFNNGGFGNVKKNQTVDYGGRLIGWDLANPDFVKYAEAFGAMGLRASSPEELRVALQKAFAVNGPVVIEVPFDDLPDWRPLDRRYKMRG